MRHADRIRDVDQIADRAEGQRVAIHIGGIQLNVTVLGWQAAITDGLIKREVLDGRDGIDHRR
ncbi:hypothetical protein D3C80_2073980 [compost metagenome]